MKRTVITTLLLTFCLGAAAQGHKAAIDSAELVVQRYYRLLNYEGLRNDSILYLETVSYKRSNTADTAMLKRWFLPPNRFRAELWHGDTLLEGIYTDGKKVFGRYNRNIAESWRPTGKDNYYDLEPGYDFRGALYSRVANASKLVYKGVWDFNGHKVYRIFVDTPYKYCRNYLFEQESGLLFMIEETKMHSEYTNHQSYDHPDWHAIHEYQPLGNTLLPSVESYQMQGDMVFHFTTGKYIPMDMKIFTDD